jgi:hypothetical protein
VRKVTRYLRYVLIGPPGQRTGWVSRWLRRFSIAVLTLAACGWGVSHVFTAVLYIPVPHSGYSLILGTGGGQFVFGRQGGTRNNWVQTMGDSRCFRNSRVPKDVFKTETIAEAVASEMLDESRQADFPGIVTLRAHWSTYSAAGSGYFDATGVSYWWLMIAGGLGLGGAVLADRRRSRKREQMGLCLECGYDLRASKDTCPECGTPFVRAAGQAPAKAEVA